MDEINTIVKGLEEYLGVTFVVQDITDVTLDEEKKFFVKMVNHLEKLEIHEHKIFESFKIDLSTITQPYWAMIEECLSFSLSAEIQDMIWWYIHDRKNAAGELIGWEDEDGTEYKFKTPGDLYEFILHKFDDIK
jgi:hypothetical protein